jgi:hypothetical protein
METMDKELESSMGLVGLYQFVREEQLFCALLTHLLWQQGSNLPNFLKLVNETRLTEKERFPFSQLEAAQMHLEFSYLRDHWDSLVHENEAKRQRIFTLLSRVPLLSHYHIEAFPQSIPDFNAFFMGQRGNRIINDIVSEQS